jgi:hypothetical protein
MKTKIKALAPIFIFVLLLSGCAPTEGYTNQFPQHVKDVIEQFEQGGYVCDEPTLYLSSGNPVVNSDYPPDRLTCNKSDSNFYGEEFEIFASEEEAASYYQQSCNSRKNGWWHMNFMLSPTVEMTAYEKTVDQANQLAQALGYSNSQELTSSCDYSDLTW